MGSARRQLIDLGLSQSLRRSLSGRRAVLGSGPVRLSALRFPPPRSAPAAERGSAPPGHGPRGDSRGRAGLIPGAHPSLHLAPRFPQAASHARGAFPAHRQRFAIPAPAPRSPCRGPPREPAPPRAPTAERGTATTAVPLLSDPALTSRLSQCRRRWRAPAAVLRGSGDPPCARAQGPGVCLSVVRRSPAAPISPAAGSGRSAAGRWPATGPRSRPAA